MDTNPRQLCALGFCAFTVPAVLTLPRIGWFWACIAGAGCALLLGVLVMLRLRGAGSAEAGGEAVWRLLPLLPWNLLLLGAVAARLCDVYPTGRTFPLIGLLLLLLAAYAARKGVNAVLRVGAIVFFFLVVFFALILGFSLPDLHTRWLKPVFSVDWRYLPAVLAPVPALYLFDGKGRIRRLWPWLVGGVVFALVCALVTAGSLSPALAAQEKFAFYEAAKGVSVLGAMERLEPLVSAAMTAGGFCLLALLCAVNERIFAAVFPKVGNIAVGANVLLGGAAVWLSGLLPLSVLAIGTTIFWGLFPLITQLLVFQKK